jgi:hypothetical protein
MARSSANPASALRCFGRAVLDHRPGPLLSARKWDPPATDGGAPVPTCTVTASPDGVSQSFSGVTDQATLSGLADAATDLSTVTATNAIDTGLATTDAPPNVVTEQIVAPNAAATPVSGGDLVTVFDANVSAGCGVWRVACAGPGRGRAPRAGPAPRRRHRR